MLYAIGDLHLSLSADKPMEVFGDSWRDYVARIQKGFQLLGEDDLCVLCGDVSWGMSLEQCLEDFKFIDALPGKKLLLKGNHDYWWSTATKAKTFFRQHELRTLDVLHNNCFVYGDIAVCGTRGWFFEEETGGEHDKKVMARELGRLERSLQMAPEGKRKVCFLHYPPRYGGYICREMVALMEKYGVMDCYYGHIHGKGHRQAVTGIVDGICYHMVSADFVGFQPRAVL